MCRFIVPILVCLIKTIFESVILIITQYFGVIVVTKYKHTTLAQSSKDLVIYGVTKIVIGYALGLGIG